MKEREMASNITEMEEKDEGSGTVKEE